MSTAEAVEHADAQDRGEQRAGEPEHERERREVGEQQVLGHVRDEQVVGGVVDRRGERDHDEHQAR